MFVIYSTKHKTQFMKNYFILFSTLSIMAFTSCSKNDAQQNQNKSSVQLLLTDAPAPYDAVNIDIQRVEINTSGDDGGWVSYPVAPKTYDLLLLRNGQHVTMGDPLSLPDGKIEQIRLILGSNNTVVVDGQTYPLTTPSAQQSGLKINFHKDLAPNGVYRIWLDFDANRSIHKTGNGKYMLKPVIKAFSEETNGQLRGYVLPAEAKAVVYALRGVDTVGSAIPAADGYYKFVGLTDGVYTLSLNADDATGYKDATLNNLNVVYGKVTDAPNTTLIK